MTSFHNRKLHGGGGGGRDLLTDFFGNKRGGVIRMHSKGSLCLFPITQFRVWATITKQTSNAGKMV